MRVLLNAVPFGYGPVSKCLSVAKALLKHGVDCAFCGSGIAYEFMKRENICDVYYYDLYQGDISGFTQFTEMFTHGLSCMEPLFIRYCSNNMKVSFMDSLMWMWDKDYFNRYPELKTVQYYFVQNTFAAKDKSMNFGIQNLRYVGAIIDVFCNELDVKKCKYLINFGGVENTCTRLDLAESYPVNMIKFLTEKNIFSTDTIVCSSRNISEYINKQLSSVYKMCSLNHSQFLGALKSAQILVTTPGLTTLLEAYALQIPTIFLPPQNYSQYLILKYIANEGYPLNLMNYDFFYHDFTIKDDIKEEVAVEIIERQAKCLFGNVSAMEAMSKELTKQCMPNCRDNIIHFQNKIIDTIGTNGAEDIAKILLNSM